MPTHRRALFILSLLGCFALFSLAVALMSGSMAVSVSDVFSSLTTFSSATVEAQHASFEVVRSLRLPRALAGFACGGLLALSGALLQVLLRNPLADPYILGISGGASVGAILAIFFGLGVAVINSAAFVGALLAMLIVFGLARGDGRWTQTRLLLTGVIIASGCGAFVALMLSIAADYQLRTMLFWLMGDLSQASAPGWALVALGVILLCVLPFARELNLLTHGENMAHVLGVQVKNLRRGVYVLASLATAVAVTQAGSIGFVGLIVPHLVRLSLGNDQRLLLPASVLAGGGLLVIADTLARTVLAPQQLPVGILTAMIGVPVFLFLLARDAKTSR